MLAGRVRVDPRHLAIVARLEVWLAHQHRQDRRLGTRLRVVRAPEPLTEATVRARTQAHPERIAVRLRHVSRGLRERLVTQLLRRLRKQRMTESLLLSRIRIRT